MAHEDATQPRQKNLRPNEVAENQVIRLAAQAILARGDQLAVHNGEDWSQRPTDDVDTVLASLRETDSDVLHVCRDGRRTGSYVLLVYGNDPCEILADWTIDLEEVLAPAVAHADTLEARF